MRDRTHESFRSVSRSVVVMGDGKGEQNETHLFLGSTHRDGEKDRR